MVRKLISLGTRCDVAFQLRMHSGDNTSHFFDWLALDSNAVIQIIEKDFNVFAPDDLKFLPIGNGHNHVQDAVTGARFHHHFPMAGGSVISDFLTAYPQFIGKFEHLANRFRMYALEHPVTFVRRKITLIEAQKLEEVFFKKFPGADARFVYINNSEDTFQTKHGKSYNLPESKYSVGDPIVWSKFLLENSLIENPYQLSAEQILGKGHEGHGLGTNNRFTVEHMLDACKNNPNNIDFHLELCKIYRKNGEIDLALQCLDKAEVFSTHLERVAIERIITLKHGNRISEAQFMEDGSELPDHEFQLSAPLGYSFYKAGKHEEAVRHFSIHLKSYPLDDFAMLFKALALRSMGRFQDSERTIAASLALNPNRARSRLLKSILLRRRGLHEEALKEAQIASDLSPDNTEYKMFISKILEDQNRLNDAKTIQEVS